MLKSDMYDSRGKRERALKLKFVILLFLIK